MSSTSLTEVDPEFRCYPFKRTRVANRDEIELCNKKVKRLKG
jgi:hypothetical protein